MRRSEAALAGVGALVVLVAFALVGWKPISHKTPYYTSVVLTGTPHAGDSCRYFALAGGLTGVKDSTAGPMDWVRITSANNGQDAVRLFGQFGTANPDSGHQYRYSTYLTMAEPTGSEAEPPVLIEDIGGIWGVYIGTAVGDEIRVEAGRRP